ncbi:MAG: macro domain-containing protein [Candidatus Methanoperedens sp.]|nr:macro domain-containing protein [Candidatus Methanoperedens sp.]
MLETPADIRVNTVNCVGVMGAGVALAFKNNYPEMYKDYQKACKDGKVIPGKLHIWKNLSGEWIINFPTKRHYKEPSRYEDIEDGLIALHDYILDKGKVRVALPALGCGHGGLDWERIKGMIKERLGDLEATFTVFEPLDSHLIGDAFRDKALQASEEKLVHQGVKIIKPSDNFLPLALKGRTASPMYIKGNDALLKQPILAFLSSLKPDEREIKAALKCLELVARPGLSIMVGYSPLLDRPIIRKALELGSDIIIAFPEGLLNFGVRKDIKDVWDENRIAILTLSSPNQRWAPQTASRAKELSMAFANVVIITDCNPQWLSRFAERKEFHIPCFYINYDRSCAESLELSNIFNAKPIGEGTQIDASHVTPLLEVLGMNNLKSQLPAKSSIKTASSSKMEITSFVPASQINEKPSAYATTARPLPDENKVRGHIITQYPKRLIEVDLPIKRISEYARKREHHGRLATLHAWWARKPSSACRAIICAALWPDPADQLCPVKFRNDCSRILRHFFDPMGTGAQNFEDPIVLRGVLLEFIADFAKWDNSIKKEYLETSRALTHSAHESLGGSHDTKPLVFDPFAGGGSIPLEALRIGADAFASDLNPVAVILNKVVLEYIPKYGQHLSDEVRKWGEWIKQEAEKELAELYPKDPDGATPIAYLWARTITCEGPGCGAIIPMKSSMWLAQKGNRQLSLAFEKTPNTKNFKITIEENPKHLRSGTVRRGAVTCPVCGYTTPIKNVRLQLRKRHGGAIDSMLLAVVIKKGRQVYRDYREPESWDLEAIQTARNSARELINKKIGELSLLPDEPTPEQVSHRSVVSPRIYGIEEWRDFFTPRQIISISTLCSLIRKCAKVMSNECSDDLSVATQTVLALVLDKTAQYNSSACRWKASGESFVDMFGHHAFTFGWDFAESVPIGDAVGSFESITTTMVQTISDISSTVVERGNVGLFSAVDCPLPDESTQIVVTDPPYYDAVAYGDLSDFFYVWLKRTLYGLHPDIFGKKLVPKDEEIIVKHPNSVQEHEMFLKNMQKAMEECRRVLVPNGLGVVIFAHKSTSGWEAQLDAMLSAGWIITASWPLHTELESRLSASGTASLASSIHLVCRPRASGSESAIGDWREVLQELPVRIHEWMPRLAQEGVVGADAIFACLGPALEIFSRYSRVEKASGEQVTLKVYLEHVWAAVAKEALGLIFHGADATGFEEDARLTAMWLWTLSTGANGNGNKKIESEIEDDEDAESSGKSPKMSGFVLEYDAARKIAQGLGAHLEQLTKLVEIKGDKARLLPVEERTAYLFGKEDIKAPKSRKKKEARQLTLTGVVDEAEEESGGWGEMKAPPAGTTVLDRVHQAMILFAAGRSDALKRFLVEDGIGKDERFWRLAQAFSALYPAGTDEKRWVEGLMAKKKGLGF